MNSIIEKYHIANTDGIKFRIDGYTILNVKYLHQLSFNP